MKKLADVHAKLLKLLDLPNNPCAYAWLNCIGVGKNSLIVYVTNNDKAIKDLIPEQIDGIPIEIRVTGKIRPALRNNLSLFSHS